MHTPQIDVSGADGELERALHLPVQLLEETGVTAEEVQSQLGQRSSIRVAGASDVQNVSLLLFIDASDAQSSIDVAGASDARTLDLALVLPHTSSTPSAQAASSIDVAGAGSVLDLSLTVPSESSPTPTATFTPTSTHTVTPTATPTLDVSTEGSLYVVSETQTRNSYLLEGADLDAYAVGDSLVVYAEFVPGVEVPIALLRIVARNPTSLSTQAILVHPRYRILPRLRVDGDLENLSTSELVPSVEGAAGYLLREGRVRLHSDVNADQNTLLEAFQPEVVDEAIIDYLPFSPPIRMRVQSVGIGGVVAQVELLSGEWPPPGTLMAAVR